MSEGVPKHGPATDALKALTEELTRVTGYITVVELELLILKYGGNLLPGEDTLTDRAQLKVELGQLRSRMARVAYFAGIVTVNVKKQLAARRLGADA